MAVCWRISERRHASQQCTSRVVRIATRALDECSLIAAICLFALSPIEASGLDRWLTDG